MTPTDTTSSTELALFIVNGFTFLGLVVNGLFSYFRDKDARRERLEQAKVLELAAKNAVKSKEVAESVATNLEQTKAEKAIKTVVLDRKLDDIGATVVGVYGLVNGRMTAQLRINLDLATRLAEHTKHPEDLARVRTAQQALDEHEARQAAYNAAKG